MKTDMNEYLGSDHRQLVQDNHKRIEGNDIMGIDNTLFSPEAMAIMKVAERTLPYTIFKSGLSNDAWNGNNHNCFGYRHETPDYRQLLAGHPANNTPSFGDNINKISVSVKTGQTRWNRLSVELESEIGFQGYANRK